MTNNIYINVHVCTWNKEITCHVTCVVTDISYFYLRKQIRPSTGSSYTRSLIWVNSVCKSIKIFFRPAGAYLLDFFCSGIQFYLLLSPYLCFISFLYLDLYVLGDYALISYGSFMQTKHQCVLIHI